LVKLNIKALKAEKEQLNKQWDKWMKDAEEGIIDRYQVVHLMGKLNSFDQFFLHQGVKFNA